MNKLKLAILAFILLTGMSMELKAEPVPLSVEAKSLKKGIYQHYKGKLYEVISIAHHCETLDEFVVYRMLYEDFGYWIRPVSMFYETVVDANNEVVPRFRFIGEPGNIEGLPAN